MAREMKPTRVELSERLNSGRQTVQEKQQQREREREKANKSSKSSCTLTHLSRVPKQEALAREQESGEP